MPPSKDYTGMKVGELVALHPTEKRRGSGVIWVWTCSCGNTREAVPNDLIQKNKEGVISRCLLCNHAARKATGEASKNMVLYNYRRHARERGIAFSLSIEEAEILFQSNCFYCGTPPSNKMEKREANGPYIYNGIDRVDSTKGYSIDNCVSCCKNCNRSKSDLSFEEFITWLLKASENIRESIVVNTDALISFS